jgi:nicotinate-nucleotide adenylyltransferase
MSEAPVTPLEVPKGAPGGGARLVLFGGTFDPPHRAHVELPLAARTLIEARFGEGAWLVFVPAARSPHKEHGPEVGDEERLAMLRIALGEAGVREGEADRVAIWTDEMDRARWAAERGEERAPSYMAETLRRVGRAVASPFQAMALLLGADQALAFHRWAEAREILRMAEVFVMPRDEVGTGAALVGRLRELGVWSEEELARWAGAVLGLPMVDLAATPVRVWLRAPGRHEAALAAALGPAVLRYVRERGLYGTP